MDLEELRSVREQERRTDSLQHLRDSFYDDAAEYVRQLKHERSRRAEQAGDPYAAAAMRLTDEIDTAEEVIESLYERRRGKVVKLASFAAAGMPAETDGMTEQERSMFDDVVERIENNEERVLGALDGSGDAQTQVDGATDAGRAVPATDTAGTTSAADAARASDKTDAVGSPTETDLLGTAGETDAGDDTDPVGAAPTPEATEEPVAAAAESSVATDDAAATADGVGDGNGGTAEGGDGSVLADAMGGPADDGSADGATATDETQPTASGDASDPPAESSGDRPAAEAAVATGVEEPPAATSGTDAVDGGEVTSADATSGSANAAAAPPDTAAASADTTAAPSTGDATPQTAGGAPAGPDTVSGDGTTTDDGAVSGDGTTTDDGTVNEGGPTTDDRAADDTPTVERSTVRVTSDVGEVFGVDDRTYELAASDVVHLPRMVAEPLVEQGVAEQL